MERKRTGEGERRRREEKGKRKEERLWGENLGDRLGRHRMGRDRTKDKEEEGERIE